MGALTRKLNSSLIWLSVLAAGCFNPGFGGDTDSNTATDTSPTDGTVCQPGENQVCTCEDNSSGIQVCTDDGTSFSACECEQVDSGPTMDSTGTDPTGDSTTGPPPECVEDEDCAGMATHDCEQGLCTDGTCEVQLRPAGSPCGDETDDECTARDTCDEMGACLDNHGADGTSCTVCDQGICACAAGACEDCAFAPINNFITDRSIADWTLTGDWALYREAPQSFTWRPTRFGSQVLGTDGNRTTPYPSSHTETSHARTAPLILPASLEFQSWNVDQGSGSDNKWVRVSVDDGATWQTLADCELDPAAYAFCQPRDEQRAPEDWDLISIPVPPELAGQIGRVEFAYDTVDSCCDFEQGWFIDVANFPTECTCIDDQSCAGLGGECGDAVCGAGGECELAPQPDGTACGDTEDSECNGADACDGVGYCLANEAATGLTTCSDCPAGAGSCGVCQLGVCPDCSAEAPAADFGNTTIAINGWLIEDLSGTGADWQIYLEAPPNALAGSAPIPLSFAPSFGIDGNRQAPYDLMVAPFNEELEHSRITTTPDVLPAEITFDSWHQDEGGSTAPNFYDTKLIEVSVDDGATWMPVVDCSVDPPGMWPFCTLLTTDRAGTLWDAITIDTSAWAGMVGQLRFTYNTQDPCCEEERGWFIDNLNFAQSCLDPAFP